MLFQPEFPAAAAAGEFPAAGVFVVGATAVSHVRWEGPANARADGRLGQAPRLTCCGRAGLQPALTVNWALFSAPVLRNCILLPFVTQESQACCACLVPLTWGGPHLAVPAAGCRVLPSAPDLLWGDRACEQTKAEPSGWVGWPGQTLRPVQGDPPPMVCLGLHLLRVREGPESRLVALCPRWQVARAVVSIRGRAPTRLVLE